MTVDLNADDRAMLGAVVRRELIRNVLGDDELMLWEPGNGAVMFEVPDFAALRRLETAGLIRLPDGRGERYWEITDKALEA